MSDTDKLLRAILAELRALRVVIAPDKRAKLKGAASVSAISRNAVTGMVYEAGDDSDLPLQLTVEEQQAMRGQGRATGRRRNTRPFGVE